MAQALYLERWLSGRKRRSRKPFCRASGNWGSNPHLSATLRDLFFYFFFKIISLPAGRNILFSIFSSKKSKKYIPVAVALSLLKNKKTNPSVPQNAKILKLRRAVRAGRRSTIGNRVCPKRVSGVRIPSSPPERVKNGY